MNINNFKIDPDKLYGLDSLLSKNGGPLPISRSSLYTAAKRGEIPVVKIGLRRRMFISGKYILSLLT